MADGTSNLKVLGMVDLHIKVNHMITTIKATVVRSLFTDCIIGTDYIKKYGLKVDAGEETVTICKQKQGTTIPMVKQDQPLYVPLRLKQTTKIPPQQRRSLTEEQRIQRNRLNSRRRRDGDFRR
ncbi:unnamed protein product, partial [Didymodactylos carnosus]